MGCVRSFLAVLGTKPLRRFCCLAAETSEGENGLFPSEAEAVRLCCAVKSGLLPVIA